MIASGMLLSTGVMAYLTQLTVTSAATPSSCPP
jgi:hypothetical protein